MKFILGKKIEMTQRFLDNGRVMPVTAVMAGPCSVVQVKTKAKDGYQSIQVGFGKKKKLSKSLRGHLKGLELYSFLREFRTENSDEIKRGAQIDIQTFSKGDRVKVTGFSKGKGFQGVVRRHGFGGSPATHGHKDQLRMPGSIGNTAPQRVLRGRRMGGQMGNTRITVGNLEIIDVIPEENILLIKGAVPGARNGLLLITAPGELKIKQTAGPAKEAAAPVVEQTKVK